jgi:hypothetical protein
MEINPFTFYIITSAEPEKRRRGEFLPRHPLNYSWHLFIPTTLLAISMLEKLSLVTSVPATAVFRFSL